MSSSKNRQANSSKTILPVYKMFAVERRYMGDKYEMISAKIKEKFGVERTSSTVRWWLCSAGPLYDFYKEYAQGMNLEAVKELKNHIKRNATSSLAAIIQIIRSDGHQHQFRAAKTWVEWALELSKEDYQEEEEEEMLDKFFNRIEEEVDSQENNEG